MRAQLLQSDNCSCAAPSTRSCRLTDPPTSGCHLHPLAVALHFYQDLSTLRRATATVRAVVVSALHKGNVCASRRICCRPPTASPVARSSGRGPAATVLLAYGLPWARPSCATRRFSRPPAGIAERGRSAAARCAVAASLCNNCRCCSTPARQPGAVIAAGCRPPTPGCHQFVQQPPRQRLPPGSPTRPARQQQ